MKKPPLHVFTAGARVGTLTRSDVEQDTVLFTYRDDTPTSDAVSLSMPIRSDQYDSMGGLLPVFEMNLPEGALRERLRLQFAKAIPEFDDLDLLHIVGASQIGRLRYTQREQINLEVPPQDLQEILTHTGSADLFAHLLQRFAKYSGISGMQPKVLVRDEKAPDKLTHIGATHIVKTFDPAEYPELAANEFICTLGAKAAGLQTAHLQLSKNRRFLIVDRFDLSSNGTYLGIEDFCVLNGRRSHRRYDGAYEQVAGRIRDYVSPTALQHACEQYALMVVYSCTVGNGDAHLKNFSVLYRNADDTVELSPAYDLVSTQLYLPKDTLALTLEGTKEFPRRKTLLKFIRLVTGKTARAAVQLLDQVKIGAETAIEQARQYATRHADAQTFSDRFVHTVEAGLQRLAA